MRRDAFTLIELVLVVILVLLTVTILPALTERLYRPVALEAAALQFEADIRHTRQLAIAQRTSHAVEFAVGSCSYSIVRDPGGARETEGTESLPHGVTVASTTLPGERVQFDLIGSAISGGQIILRVPGSGETLRITIAAGSGTVERGG